MSQVDFLLGSKGEGGGGVMRGEKEKVCCLWLMTLTESTPLSASKPRHHGKNRPGHRGSHDHFAEVLKFALNSHLWVS